MLGKRKRESVIFRRAQDSHEDNSTPSSILTGANDVFQKYFEERFDPLPNVNLAPSSQDKKVVETTSDDELDEDFQEHDEASEWSGISDDLASTTAVEVVDYTHRVQQEDNDPIGKLFQKSYMTSKPPRESQRSHNTSQASKLKSEEEAEEVTNLKHDLDLQRLLRESHLLEHSRKNSDGGVQRHKATDLQLRSLGSKSSLFTQQKMPMSHRKGIVAKTSSKDAQRRKDAKENGVILEKPAKKTSGVASRRDRGVDVPVVGKFRDGILQLSRKDVASIQGPRRAGSRKGRR